MKSTKEKYVIPRSDPERSAAIFRAQSKDCDEESRSLIREILRACTERSRSVAQNDNLGLRVNHLWFIFQNFNIRYGRDEFKNSSITFSPLCSSRYVLNTTRSFPVSILLTFTPSRAKHNTGLFFVTA